MQLSGKTALITGAGSGIGRALAVALANKRCHLALVDRNSEGLNETVALLPENVTVSAHVLDITDERALSDLPAEILQKHAFVDILINNAGITSGGRFQQLRQAHFDVVLNVNFHAPVKLTRLLLPHLLQRPEARIVNVSSLYGLIAGRDQSAYSASKFAITGFSYSLQHDLAGTGVGVTVVFPGGVSTSIVKNAIPPEGLTGEQLQKRRAGEQKLLRMSPEKAAAAIVDGIERDKKRVLIGGDVRFMDRLSRLFPERYASIMRTLTRLAKKLG
jgi:short-subunit dehydrogenase